ncbi:MAG: hypothetical protein RR690_03990 [Longicatena sp.]
MKLKKRFLHVNNNGFISMYALMILSIFLLFATMCTQKIVTYTYIRKQERAMLIDLYIIENIQDKIQESKENDVEDRTEINEHEVMDVESEEKEIEKEEIVTWEGEYESTVFYFDWNKQQVFVTYMWDYELKKVNVQLSEEFFILDYAYGTP